MGGKREEKEWAPCTTLGRLVKNGQITTIEDIYLHSLPIKEYQIVDILFPAQQLKDDVMKIMPVQKQTSAGQNSRFVCHVAVGDSNGHIGLGNKCAKEVATAIRGGIIAAKLNLIPVRRGYWGNKIGLPHTVAMKGHGKCGSVRMRLVPAPRGTGVVGAPATKKMLAFAGVADCFTCSCGHTKTRGNFIKAIFAALKDVCVSHAGSLEAHAVRPDSVPGVLGHPAADEVQDGRVLSVFCRFFAHPLIPATRYLETG